MLSTLYSKWQTQQTHASFQLGLSAVQTSDAMSKTQGDGHVLLQCPSCFVVM